MILLDELYEKLLREFWLLKEDDWIEWIAKDNDFRDDCDKFDGCYFIVKQMPMYPQHPRCQCQIKKLPTAISRKTVKVNCDIKKFKLQFSTPDNQQEKEPRILVCCLLTVRDENHCHQF